MASFEALVLDLVDDKVEASIETLDPARLPADGDVTVDVEYSSLNYKDALILAGIGRMVRTYPHVPGIDLAGTVSASSNAGFRAGDRAVLTGWRVGELWWGGFAAQARVKGEWLTPLPAGLTTRQAMAVGTAGFTAMMAIDALERHGATPDGGPILVTGASGGLGSMAVHLLSRLGFEVTASTGKAEEHDYLRTLGAHEVINRAELADPPAKPLLSERWAGCIDSVGGATLAHVLAELRYGGSVAVCGNAGGNDLPTSVLPLVLRAVNLLGVESVQYPITQRPALWDRLVAALDLDQLDAMTTEIALPDVPARAADVLGGRVRGRTVVAL